MLCLLESDKKELRYLQFDYESKTFISNIVGNTLLVDSLGSFVGMLRFSKLRTGCCHHLVRLVNLTLNSSRAFRKSKERHGAALYRS